jgi:NAD(P)-dependent dehydrogenase (short-subunit alcohol dehydrogenase family)
MNPEKSALFAGRVALVTGASSGIGRATALRLAKAGARVVAVARDEARLGGVVHDLGESGEGLVADLTCPGQIVELMTRIAACHGRLDILVINAGVSNAPDIGDLDPVAYDRLMDVNVKGAVFTFARALPLLAEGASVVFVGSVAGRGGQPGDPLYAGSKGFIRALIMVAGLVRPEFVIEIEAIAAAPG